MAGQQPVPGGLDALPGTLYLTCPQCDTANVVMNLIARLNAINDLECDGCGIHWTVDISSSGQTYWTRKEEPHG